MPDARASRNGTGIFVAALLAALALLLRFCAPYPGGDVVEYMSDAVAIATHGSPALRLDDVVRARTLVPALAPGLAPIEHDIRVGKQEVHAAFVRGRSGNVYPVHFFGYSALVALPFTLLDRLGANPVKAFQVVNYAALFVLGLALLRFFGSPLRSAVGLLLFLLGGGVLYMNWTSPEFLSAAGLLAGLLLFLADAPLAGGVLAGLAGQQNPTIVMFFGFAPLLKMGLARRAGTPLRAALTRADVAGLAAGLAVFALPPLFNLAEFGVPNIIARKFSDPHLMGAARLTSFFFDLNQGMILAVPGVLAALAFWRWRGQGLATGLCVALVLALVVPALAVLNWNSGAAGIMRYAFWAAMPILLALLLRLRAAPAWPRALVGAVLAVQALAMLHASRYSYVEPSPLARAVMARLPRWYHPEPEIFAERMGNNDDYIHREQVYTYQVGGLRKSLFFPGPAADALLCGSGAALAPGAPSSAAAYGWRYVDGVPDCRAGTLPQLSWQAPQFRDHDGIAGDGWAGPGFGGGAWDGMWSLGERSRLVLDVPAGWRAGTLVLGGGYLDGNTTTHVFVDGTDLGWQRLDPRAVLALPVPLSGPRVTIELVHQAPHSPGPGDPRPLALFLREVSLRAAPPAP